MTEAWSLARKKLWGWGILIALIFLGIYFLKSILLPFVIGALVAYIFNPAVSRLTRWGLSRTLSTACVILFFFILIGGSLFIAFPFLKDQLLKLAHVFPLYWNRLMMMFQPYFHKLSPYVDSQFFELFQEKATPYIRDMFSWGVNMLKNLFDNSLALVNLISLVFLTPVVAFYLLRDWPKILQEAERLLPRDHVETVRHQVHLINKTLGEYIRGQALVCFSLASFYSTALMLVDLNFALTLGIITGILTFIPYLGFLISLITAMGLAFAQFDTWGPIGAVTLVYVLGQALESYVLTPRLVGDRVGLHPVWIIFSLLAGGVLFGFLGIIIAVPTAATLGVLMRFILQKYFDSPYYRSLKKKIPSSRASLKR